jgi:alkylation response protein AidB-like acyl-CoA dehydrogenase
MAESSELDFLRETTRRFIGNRAPMSVVRRLLDDPNGYDPDYWKAAAELGWPSLLIDVVAPSEAFGDALSALVVVAEEFGRSVAPGPLVPVNVVGAALSRHPDFPGGDRVAGELANGEKTAAWCYAEKRAPWLDAGAGLSISSNGDDLVLSGHKDYVEAGATADYLLVVGYAEEGLAQVLIPSSFPGVSVTRWTSLDFTKRFSRVEFADCRVPAGFRIGSSDMESTDDIALQRAVALILQCAESVGVMAEVLGRTIDYAQDRVAFGRPIATYQAIKHALANAKVELEASRGAVSGAVQAVSIEADNWQEIVSVMKAYVGETAPRLVQSCIQVHGAIGVTWEHDLHLFLRRVSVNRALYGTPEDHRRFLGRMSMPTGETVKAGA